MLIESLKQVNQIKSNKNLIFYTRCILAFYYDFINFSTCGALWCVLMKKY